MTPVIYRIAVARQYVYLEPMGIAEEQRRRERQYREILPEIVAGITSAEDPVSLAGSLARRVGVDETTMFRWVRLAEEGLEAARRRRATALAVVLWVGVFGVIVPLAGRVLGWFATWTPMLIASTVSGLGATITALVALGRVRSVAFRKWMEREIGTGEDPD
jgi:hypothetical protein